MVSLVICVVICSGSCRQPIVSSMAEMNRQGGDSKAPGRLAGPADEAYDIRIAADGTWYYQGTPIRRHGLARLFASVLRRDDAGDYWLITPAERGRIQVDDAPFVAVDCTVSGGDRDQSLVMHTNMDETVAVDRAHPLRVAFDPATGEPRPYVMVRAGLEALVLRSVYYRLADLAVEWDGRLGVWSGGVFFPLDAPD